MKFICASGSKQIDDFKIKMAYDTYKGNKGSAYGKHYSRDAIND